MILLMKEIDSFTKGDGKPFNAEENVFRNFDLRVLNTNIYSIFKSKNNNLSIRRVFLYDKNSGDLLIPVPKDLALDKKTLIKAKLKEINGTYIVKFKSNTKIKEVEGYVSLKNLEYYIFDENDVFLEEHKIIEPFKENIKAGIKLNRLTRTTETGFLYFQNFTNLREDVEENENKKRNIFILAEIENLSNYKKIVILGGESKCFLILKDDNIKAIKDLFNDAQISEEELKEEIKKTKYFKIILLTPTNHPPKIEGTELVAQLIGKPIAFSGWFNVYDNDEKIDSFPSRLFKLIPAGSVFYYKLKEESKLDEIFDKYWLKPTFFVKEYPYFEKLEDGTNPLSFGLSIIGVAQVEE